MSISIAVQFSFSSPFALPIAVSGACFRFVSSLPGIPAGVSLASRWLHLGPLAAAVAPLVRDPIGCAHPGAVPTGWQPGAHNLSRPHQPRAWGRGIEGRYLSKHSNQAVEAKKLGMREIHFREDNV